MFVVGHVTKGGGIAGPKTLEHIVDTVLYFEGETGVDHRILRATKNRFGGVDEIGVFRMAQSGLVPVENPSELFLGDRHRTTSGSAVTALLEGTRPVLIEVQALAAKAGFGTPQRVATGYDSRRLALLLAVLDKRAEMSFAALDVFLNVVGGVRLHEPAGDLAVTAALASSVFDRPVPADAVFIGEVGLGGEIRPVSQAERRLAEAAKMGMTTAYLADRAIPRRQVADIRTDRRVDAPRTVRPTFHLAPDDPAARASRVPYAPRRERRRVALRGRRRGARRGRVGDADRDRRSSNSSAGSPGSRCCCTACSGSRPGPMSRWSCACSPGHTSAIRRPGSFSPTSNAC